MAEIWKLERFPDKSVDGYFNFWSSKFLLQPEWKMIDSDNKLDIDVSMISRMVYEETRLNSFTQKEQWPFLKDCNCTPEKVPFLYLCLNDQ